MDFSIPGHPDDDFDPDDPGFSFPSGVLSAHAPQVGGGLAQGGIINEESTVWSPDGFVTLEQYNTKGAGLQPRSLLLAYVQPILAPLKQLFSKFGHVLGEYSKPTNDDCGKIFRKVQCSSNSLHHPSYKHIRCNDPGCPICYVKFAARLASSITERIQGFKKVYRNKKIHHTIIWTKKDQQYADLSSAMNEGIRLAKIAGFVAGVIWYHPYRIKKEMKEALRRYRTINKLDGKAGFWKMAHDDVLQLGNLEYYIEPGPHWHIEGAGWLMNVKEFFVLTGCGYKKRRYLDDEREVYEVAYYISTHACREFGKAMVRYFGDMSYSNLAREHVETKIKDVLCKDCGSRLEEHECDEDGNIEHNGVPLSKIRDNITEKIKYYLYWKKGHPKPEMKDAWQCLISRFDNRNIN